MPGNSKIFLPNRALGYVSNHIPLVTRYIHRRKDNIIVTCVGRSFHSYSCAHLALLAVSALHESEITCMAGDTFHVYTACGNTVYAWRRGTELKHTYSGHCSPVHLLLPFGPHLLSVDEDSILKIWDIKTEETYGELMFHNNTFRITAMCHPVTYINKILLGSEQGQMQLWNIRLSSLIYTFVGWSSQVTVLEQPPAVDVMGVGLADGRIILHNLKYDETVMTFTQDWGLVTGLSFRTDGHPIMASGSLSGHVVFWDLQEKKVASQLLSAHSSAVNSLKCLPNEPLLVTSSADNSLKLWIFDMPDGGARLLRIREGHSAAPTCIRFHDSNGKCILTAGGDSSLRVFNTITEAANQSLGKAYYDKKLAKKKGQQRSRHLKMPPVIQFASETTREKEWDNIACIHLGVSVVTTWSFNKCTMGELKLMPQKLNGEPLKIIGKFTATSICLTHCGNFVVIGYSTGNVERFNIQSGKHRGSYGVPTAHKGPTRGVAVDPLNQLVTTGGSDARVNFWDFKKSGKPPLTALDVKEAVTFFQTHRESSLLCVALEDFSISIIDMETRTIVRHFTGHTGQLTDATFSPDSRWLVTAGMDCIIRTWDIPTAQLVDSFQVDVPCTSLTLSPTGEFLATTHVDYLGIFLWSNRTLFSHVSLKPIPEDSVSPLVHLPSSSLNPDQIQLDEEESDDSSEHDSPAQIEKLITLSTLATSRWQNLLDIDIVKKRNKPLEPPKAQKVAPFFLPTLPSLNLEFDFSDVLKNKDGSKYIRLDQIKHTYTPFGKLLLETTKTDDFTQVTEKLKSMGPSAIDFEVNSMSLVGGGSIELLLQFLKMVNSMLKSSQDFELGQAYLGLFLKVHGEVIAITPKLFNYITTIQENQSNGWKTLEDKFLYTLCIVDALKK